MKRFALLLLPLLIAGVALGASDGRKEKLAEERASSAVGMPAGTESTNDGWLRLTPEVSGYDYRSFQVMPSGVIWLTGFNTTSNLDYVWRSNNGGATWTRNATGTSAGITGIAARNDTLAVVGTVLGSLLRTTNGGAKWDSVYYYGAGSGFFDGVYWVGGDTAIAFGDNDGTGFLVVRSTDAGATWTRLTNIPALASAASYSYLTYRQPGDFYGNTLWITAYTGSGTAPVILKTTDRGETWTDWAVTLPGGLSNNYYFR